MSIEDISKSVHQRLLNTRDETGEQFNHLLVRYGLERLLYRIEASGHANVFILKGAVLFSLWHALPGRPTRDIDLLGTGEQTHKRLRSIFADVCAAKVTADGLRFDEASIQTDDIREGREYHGIRVRMLAFLGKARIPIQIDVGFGDALTPPPERLHYPAILDFPTPYLRAYHPATVVAEKVNAMVVLGAMNSRMKDFYDVHMILTHIPIDGTLLVDAIRATFSRRKTSLPSDLPIVFTQEFLEDGTKETLWRAFLDRSLLSSFGMSLAEVLGDLKFWLWPLLQAEEQPEDRASAGDGNVQNDLAAKSPK
ncbi:MAG: nucleotidyl transferase AbiEii/AbiGii toxin family protein [Verrucomicrobia bacterium]|nr:nucleotidyl transferase AbiEii/AbiGii toxin family protein [Verrucomicrobiota bacterium]